MALFSASDKKRIEGAVGAAEKKSQVEIVVAVNHRSSDYAAVRSLAALLLAVGAALLALSLAPAVPATHVIVALVPAWLLLYRLVGVPRICRLLVGSTLAEKAVHERAFAAFASHGLHETRERTGLLMFVSELERRVVILADRGIEALPHADWRQHVDAVVRAIREGRAADGVVQVIDELGELLAQHFPPRADDANELPNTVIEH